MKAKLLNHINVGQLDITGDYGHDLPDEEVEVLCGPFVSTIGNSPMLAWCLCETEDGRRFYIEATNLQKLEPPLEDWTKYAGKIFFEPIDWGAYRREAAKDAMCVLIGMGRDDGYKYSPHEVARYAIVYADELIKQLKEDKQ